MKDRSRRQTGSEDGIYWNPRKRLAALAQAEGEGGPSLKSEVHVLGWLLVATKSK